MWWTEQGVESEAWGPDLYCPESAGSFGHGFHTCEVGFLKHLSFLLHDVKACSRSMGSFQPWLPFVVTCGDIKPVATQDTSYPFKSKSLQWDSGIPPFSKVTPSSLQAWDHWSGWILCFPGFPDDFFNWLPGPWPGNLNTVSLGARICVIKKHLNNSRL